MRVNRVTTASIRLGIHMPGTTCRAYILFSKIMIPRAALACTRRGRGFPRPSMEYGEAKKYEYTRGKSI